MPASWNQRLNPQELSELCNSYKLSVALKRMGPIHDVAESGTARARCGRAGNVPALLRL